MFAAAGVTIQSDVKVVQTQAELNGWEVVKKLVTAFFLLLGHIIWRPCSCLSSGRTLLLFVTSRVLFFSVRRPSTCCCLYCIYVRLLCFLLQDVDWSLWLLCQRCKFKVINYESLYNENGWAVGRRLTCLQNSYYAGDPVGNIHNLYKQWLCLSCKWGGWGQNGSSFPVYCSFKNNSKTQSLSLALGSLQHLAVQHLVRVRMGQVTGNVETLSVPVDRCTVCKAVAGSELAGKPWLPIPGIEFLASFWGRLTRSCYF